MFEAHGGTIDSARAAAARLVRRPTCAGSQRSCSSPHPLPASSLLAPESVRSTDGPDRVLGRRAARRRRGVGSARGRSIAHRLWPAHAAPARGHQAAQRGAGVLSTTICGLDPRRRSLLRPAHRTRALRRAQRVRRPAARRCGAPPTRVTGLDTPRRRSLAPAAGTPVRHRLRRAARGALAAPAPSRGGARRSVLPRRSLPRRRSRLVPPAPPLPPLAPSPSSAIQPHTPHPLARRASRASAAPRTPPP